jgi:hypothetical protein
MTKCYLDGWTMLSGDRVEIQPETHGPHFFQNFFFGPSSLHLSRFLSLAGQRSSNKSNDLYQKCICLKIKWSRTMKLIFLAVEKISLRSSNFCTACNDALLR